MATARLRDGEVTLYTGGDSANWYAGFRLPDGGRLQESLKTQNKATAKEAALARHDEIKWRARFGMTQKTVTFSEAADAWLLHLENAVTGWTDSKCIRQSIAGSWHIPILTEGNTIGSSSL